MLPWDLSDQQLHAVIQYVKTFAPEVWGKSKASTPMVIGKDPWGESKATEAIMWGKKVFHAQAQCWTCHPSYATLSEVQVWGKEFGNNITEMRPDIDVSVIASSDYEQQVMPPDYTKMWIKSGHTIEDYYRVIASGVNGTAMPAWRGQLATPGKTDDEERNLWALDYYVNSLQKLKLDPEARKAFFKDLNDRRASEGVKHASAGSDHK